MRIQSSCGFLAGILSAHLAFAGQSGPNWTTPPPDHLTLFKLYMAANADVLDKDDQAAWEHYLLFKVPPTSQGPINQQCTALNTQLQNEITAQNLLNTARTDFKSALAQTKDWPRTAVFRIAARAALNPYDAASGSFPVVPLTHLFTPNPLLKVPRDAASQNDTGLPAPAKSWCRATGRVGGVNLPPTFALAITGNQMLQSLPMSASAAEAYLTAHPNRDVQFEVIVEVGPAAISPSRSMYGQVVVAARVIHARAVDPTTGQTVHQYAVAGPGTSSQPATTSAAPAPAAASPGANKPPTVTPATSQPSNRPSTSGSASSAVVPLNSYRGFLLTVRDNPEVATPAALLPPTRNQVLAEQRLWPTIQAAVDRSHQSPQFDPHKLNPKRKTFIYEWQTEGDASRTDLVDVFLRTDADWSFVTREPQWDSRFGAIVDAFLFSRKSVEGREANFAAQELVPVYKRHLDAAVAKAPTKLFLTLTVPAAGYDFSSQSIRFLQPGTNVQQGRPYEGGIELLDSTDHAKFEDLVLPASAGSTANYHLFGAVQSMQRADPPGSKPGVNLNTMSPTQTWRSYFSIGMSGSGEGENIPYVEVLALDRQLRLTSIPLDPARAEKIAKASNYATMGTIGGLTAKVYFDADRVELSQRTIGGRKARYGVLFAKLKRIDIHGPDNELLTSFEPESLPAPATRPTTTPPPAAKVPPRQTEPFGGRQGKINEAATPQTNTPSAWQPCGGALKSGESQNVASVAFVNTSKEPRRLYWFDVAGKKVLAGTVQPGLRFAMQTYTTHVWMVTDGSDKCLGTLVISKSGLIEIR
jgi:hypothetical protein